jgi:translation initiation factor 2 subunit 3
MTKTIVKKKAVKVEKPKKVKDSKKPKKEAIIVKPKVKTKIDPKLIPEINIGTLGHVDHGKSTLVEAIAGKWPASHSEELKRGITIRLGYADATIYRCEKCNGLMTADKCMKCMAGCDPVRTVSFVDSPGHETLMATVLAGASLMDGAILIIAANEPCPQPQTYEHLMTLQIAKIKKIIIVQTKIDVVSKEEVLKNYQQIKNFIKGTVAENAPIIPVSSQKKLNIDAVLEAMEEIIPTPARETGNPKMLIVRSFDVNKPGIDVPKLVGGVLGGAIVEGEMKIGDEIEIRPGIRRGNKWVPVVTKVIGLKKATYNLDKAGPGGLLGVMTSIDPSLSKADSLSGNVIGLKGKLSETSDKLSMKVNLFKTLIGKTDKILPIKDDEMLMINVGTGRTIGTVTDNKKGIININLKLPVVSDKGDTVAISRRVSDRWRLIGQGEIQ